MVWSEAVVHWTATAWAMVAQVEHKSTFEDNEYKPTAQGVHVVAPGDVPVFVMEPASHVWQEASPGFPKYPASQVVILWSKAVVHWTVAAWAMGAHVEHEATLEDNEYKPAAQGVHVVAPGEVPVFAMEPAAHVWQEASPGDP